MESRRLQTSIGDRGLKFPATAQIGREGRFEIGAMGSFQSLINR